MKNTEGAQGKRIYYICGGYNRGEDCTRHSMREDDILAALDMIRYISNIRKNFFERIRKPI